MKLVDRKGATRGNPALDRILRDIETWMTQMESRTGIAPVHSQTSTEFEQASAPAPPVMTITSEEGLYSVALEPRVPTSAPLVFEVQHSSSLPFETSADIVTLPLTSETLIEVNLPNAVRYFRARARLTNGAWSPYVFSDGVVFSSGAGVSSVLGFPAAGVVVMFNGTTKAISAIVVGDTLLGVGGESVRVDAIYTFASQVSIRLTTAVSGPADIGTDVEVLQTDGNYKFAGDMQVGDAVLERVASETRGDTLTARALQAAATLYAFALTESQTLNVSGIWCRLKI